MTFIGPSYALAAKKAAFQHSVNMYLVKMEAGEKAVAIMDSAPGYVLFADLGAPVRGCLSTNDRTFFAAGSTLFELGSDGSATPRGSLATSTGPVEIEYGLSQLVVVDGQNGYVLKLGTNDFSLIVNPAFYGSKTVNFLDNYFFFVRPDSGQFYISGLNDATSLDALDFATAESEPDNLVAILVVQRRAVMLGGVSTEIWFNSGATDFPFEREGTTIEVGCIAPHSARVLDNTAFWIGRDKSGSGIVYKLQGYQAIRISTQSVEQALQASTDLTQAVAYAYQDQGLTFYAINAPGLTSTLVFEVSTATWHDRCDLDVNGEFCPDRGVCHTYGLGQHLLGGSDGKVYRMDKSVYDKAGDPLVRERTSPHSVLPTLKHQFFHRFALDCSTGEAAQGVDGQVELSWFDWKKGSTWSNPIFRSIGKVGERYGRLTWNRLGQAIDRVWRLRYSGNTPFTILNVAIDTEQGTS